MSKKHARISEIRRRRHRREKRMKQQINEKVRKAKDTVKKS